MLNNIDTDLMDKTFYPPYLKYAYEQAGYDNSKDYLQSYYDNLHDMLGDFTFSYIDITGVLTEDDEESKSYFDNVDSTLKEIEGDDILNKITSRKIVYIGGYSMYSLESGSYQLIEGLGREVTLYLYEIDGQIYVL